VIAALRAKYLVPISYGYDLPMSPSNDNTTAKLAA
jgi:hypothetical protein